MFYRRSAGSPDPWLQEKIWIFTAGAVIAMVGMLLDNVWVMTGAAILLAAGVLLRFLPHGGEEPDEFAEPDGSVEDPE